MANLTQPSEAQLHTARAALLVLVLPYRDAEKPSKVWRAAHSALCAVEQALELPPTVPPREKRREDGAIDVG
jgi:hypothetical protein